MFFSFDGLDGVGKTTQLKLFCGWLRSLGHETVTCRDPGSTQLGEAIRELLLDRHELNISRRAEMLLYMAARAQLVDEVIGPALAAGKFVVSDRFLLANIVYQGYAGGLDVEALRQIGQIATAGRLPDLTILLDMDAAAARQRLERPLDRMELQGDDFRHKLRGGFLQAAAQWPAAIAVIDAARPADVVQEELRAAALKVMNEVGKNAT